jgi:hypothetical protein
MLAGGESCRQYAGSVSVVMRREVAYSRTRISKFIIGSNRSELDAQWVRPYSPRDESYMFYKGSVRLIGAFLERCVHPASK